MNPKYYPGKELERFMHIGEGVVTSLTKGFAVIEFTNHIEAEVLQNLWDSGWTLLHQPVVTEDRLNAVYNHVYTFKACTGD